MAGWIDDPGANQMSIHAYTTAPNTSVELYRGTATGTQIDIGGNLVYSGTYPGGVNLPGQALDLYPATYNDVIKASGVGTSYAVIKGDKPLLWEFDSTINNSPNTDRQTFLASNNSTHLGVHFYTWLSTGINGNPSDGSGFGDALAIFNPSGSPVTIDFYRGSGRGTAGTFWDQIYTKTIAADSIFMVGGSVDMRFAPTTPKLTGNSYFYGTWSQGGANTTTVYDQGDYAVASQGAPIMVWKSNNFSADGTNEPNDNIAYGVDASTGSKVGRTMYGVAGRYAVGEVLVTNMSNAATSYNIYRYTPTSPVPAGGTADRAFPTGESATGTWALVSGPNALAAAIGSSAVHSFGYDPGAFLKVLADQDVQVAFGNGFIESQYGDGDYVEGVVNHEPLDLEFYVAENLAQSSPRNALAIMAPYTGTVVTVSASPARAGFPISSAATTTVNQAIRVDLSDTAPTVYHVTTNADNAHPVYVYYQSVGTGSFGGQLEKFYSCATPKTNLPLLTLNKQVDKLVAAPGDLLTYTLNYVNAGTGIATGVVIDDSIPAGTDYVSDTGPSGSWLSGSGGPGSLRRWSLGTLGIGAYGSFQVVVQLRDAATLGAGTHVIKNQAFASDSDGNSGNSQTTVSLAVANPSGVWSSYTALDKFTGSYRQTYVHFYSLQPTTNVTLYNATASDTQINNSVYTGSAGAFQHLSYSVASNDRTYFKVEASYPINWEIDTINLTPATSGRHMFAYSTDMRLLDRVFLTRLDYEQTAGTPATDRGDSIFVVNPSSSASVNILLYFSGDHGATWNQVGGAPIAARSIYRYGGVTSSNDGEYMVVALDGDVMTYKGTALSTAYSDAFSMVAAVSDAPGGRKVATGSAGTPVNFYGGAPNGYTNAIVVTNVGAGSATYSVHRYNSTTVGAWNVNGSSGTWTQVVAPTALAAGLNAYYSTAAAATNRTFYRVEVTAGTVQVQMGGEMTTHNVGADGDSFEGVNSSGVDWLASGGTSTGGRDSRFWVAQNSTDEGRIDIIAPVAGTVLSRGSGTGSAYLATATDPATWPASTGGIDRGYQAFPSTTGNYWVSSQDAAHPIYVLYQSYELNAGTKAFACIPLVLSVVMTPTPTSSPSPTASPSPTPSPTQTATATPTPSPTPSATLTPTPTRTATPSATPSPSASPTVSWSVTDSPTPSRTATASQTPSPTPSATPSPSLTASPTPTLTATPTASPSPSQSPSATPSATSTATPTVTLTRTPTVTATATPTVSFSSTATLTATESTTATPTGTRSATQTSSLTESPSPSSTVSATQTATPTVTLTRTPTATPSATPTASSTSTATLTATESTTPTPTGTQTDTPTVTLTRTPTATPSATPTSTATPSVSPSASPSGTPTASPTESPQFTLTVTPTDTATATPSGTPTDTATVTPSATPSATASHSPTLTATPTQTPSVTDTQTLTATPSATATPSPTETWSVTDSPTPSRTATASQTATPSATESITFTGTPSWTDTPTPTPTATQSITFTDSPTLSDTPTQTLTATESVTFTGSPTQSDTPTQTLTATESVTLTDSPTLSDTPTQTLTATESVTFTGSPTQSDTPTESPSYTQSATPSGTPSATVTLSASPTLSVTPSASPSFTNSPAPSPSSSPTRTWSVTESPTPSNTASATLTGTLTATPSATPTASPTPSSTRTRTATPSATPTASPTVTGTPTLSFTASPTASFSATITPTFTISATFTVSPTITLTPTITPITNLIQLHGAYPNPFTENVKVFFSLRDASHVTLQAYNVAGEPVLSRTLDLPAGPQLQVWDGRNESGARCASGVYLIRVAASSPRDTDSFHVLVVIVR